ncbi:MAG TPA: hypothetical protein VFG19_08540 [Geobacteraceae bacterium]|nr:hypothetical protein [Geobacteraceae bacterium]
MDGLMGRYLIIVLSVIFLMSGCASMQELTDEVIKARNSGKEGVTKVYPVDEEQAWDITRAVFRWEKTDPIQENHVENYVIAGMGMKMVAFGSVMGVWIEPVDPGHTKLTVISMRRVASDIFTHLTVPRFYERFDEGVKIIKSGKELPVIPPME